MDNARIPRTPTTLAILNALSSGIDPLSGEPFPRDSAYQHPDVVRALFHALRAVESMTETATVLPPPAASAPSVPAEKKKPSRPAAAGKPWSPEEDERLAAGFDAGADITALALLHDRSRFAIEARLAKLGRVPAPEGMRYPARSGGTPKVSEPLLRYAA